jgi:predicted RNase H-like nuclease (RuvC/YqgF family)
MSELVGKTEQLKKENEFFSTKVEELNSQLEIFSTKTSKMENIFQNEKNELLLKIQQLEERKPEIIEKVVGDETKQKMLEQTLQTLRMENFNKDKKIKELEEIVSDCKKYEQKTGAVYLRGTNLDETLYK